MEEKKIGKKGSYICGSFKPGQELFLIITPFLLQKVGSLCVTHPVTFPYLLYLNAVCCLPCVEWVSGNLNLPLSLSAFFLIKVNLYFIVTECCNSPTALPLEVTISMIWVSVSA